MKELLNCTIVAGESLSTVFTSPTELTPAMLVMPSTWTTASVSFQGSWDGVTYSPVLIPNTSTEYTLTGVAASKNYALDTGILRPYRYFKLQSGTSAIPQNQSAAQSIGVGFMNTLVGVSAPPTSTSISGDTGAAITGQSLETGGSGILGWLSSIRKALATTIVTLLGGGLPAALGAGGGLKVDGSGTTLPTGISTVTLDPLCAGNNAGERIICAAAGTNYASSAIPAGTIAVQIKTPPYDVLVNVNADASITAGQNGAIAGQWVMANSQYRLAIKAADVSHTLRFMFESATAQNVDITWITQ